MTDTTSDPGGTPAWFETAFGRFYTEIYQHRDLEEADRAVAVLEARLPRAASPGGGAPVFLDIACGTGRHLAALGRRGLPTVGLDLSFHLLRLAVGRSPGRVVRGDMRCLPFADGVFAAALSMFTSFGYFRDGDENRQVLLEARRVIRPGGGLAIDYFNAVRTLAELAPESARFVGRYDVVERRNVETTPAGGERLVKTIEIFEGSKPVDTLREEVAIYRPAELEALVAGAGFAPVERLGDYDGRPFDEATSPRVLILARREP